MQMILSVRTLAALALAATALMAPKSVLAQSLPDLGIEVPGVNGIECVDTPDVCNGTSDESSGDTDETGDDTSTYPSLPPPGPPVGPPKPPSTVAAPPPAQPVLPPQPRQPTAQELARMASERGQRALAAGDYATAVVEFDRAIDLSPGNTTYPLRYHDALARMYEQKGDAFLAQGAVVAAIESYRLALRTLAGIEIRSEIEAKLEAAKGQFQHVSSIMVGGTGWTSEIYSHRHTPGETQAERMKVDAALKEQLRAMGLPLSTYMALDEFEVTVGVAVSNDIEQDLKSRVFFDQFRNGRATPELQTGYDRLKNQDTDLLVCHSNGAMVCLAALRNGDTRARRVRLYGPQISAEALAEWNALLGPPDGSGNRIDSLDIVLMSSDPIPGASYIGGMIVKAIEPNPVVQRIMQWGLGDEDLPPPAPLTVPRPPFFLNNWGGLGEETRYTVTRLTCPKDTKFTLWTLSCHEFTTYSAAIKVLGRYGGKEPGE